MTSGPDGPHGSGRNSAFGMLNLALDHVRLLVGLPVLTMLLAVAFAIIRGPEYEAQSEFMPESSEPQMGQLGGLAMQLGLGPGLMGQDESVDFYARLAISRGLLEEVAGQTYRFAVEEGGADTLSGTIPELLDVEGDTPEERLRIATDILQERVRVDADRNAGVVHVSTVVRWPGLAVQLNRAVLDAVHRFNLEKRQSSGGAERRFAEEQLEETQAELEEAEGELKEFLEANVRYEGIPELRFEANRLQRRVDLLQDLSISLAQSLQKSRLDEVRSTPTITVVSPPENSARKATSLVRTALLGFLTGLALVIAYLYIGEYAARQRATAPDEYDAFRQRRRTLFRRRRG